MSETIDLQSERDELFQLMLGRTTPKAVERILAAGYRKPRTVTTVEELDALPFMSVVMDDLGRVYQRWLLAGWQSAGPTLGTKIKLPSTVLHEGATA